MILESRPNGFGGFTVTITYNVNGTQHTDTFNTSRGNLEKLEHNLLQTRDG